MANQAGIQFNLVGLVQILLAKTITVLLPEGELQLLQIGQQKMQHLSSV